MVYVNDDTRDVALMKIGELFVSCLLLAEDTH
jgi:hypothetical protein